MKILLSRISSFEKKTNEHPRDIFLPFYLASIASILRKKNQIEIIDNDIFRFSFSTIFQKILAADPDVIILEFSSSVYKETGKLIKKIKDKNKKLKIIVFGSYTDYLPTKFLKNFPIDFIVTNEPEISIKNLIQTISLNRIEKLINIPNLVFKSENKIIQTKKEIIGNINSLPQMSHDLFLSSKYQIVSKNFCVKEKLKWGFILSSRGCPFQCIFCSPAIRNSTGKTYRSRDINLVIKEIEYLVNKLHINAISFEDDIFTVDKYRIQKLCQKIIEKKIKFSWCISTRADQLDEKTVSLLKKAGCNGAAIGIESGDNNVLKRINKGETIDQIQNGLNLLNKYDIAITANIIIGHPQETLEEIEKTVSFIKKIQPIFLHLHYLTPYPGTKIYEKFVDKKQKFDHTFYNNFNISNIPDKEYKILIKKIYFSYYLNPKYLLTYLKYRLVYWLYNPKFEMTLIVNTLKYLIRHDQQ